VRIEVRVYGDLVELTGEAELAVPVGRPRSVKDLVESVGVPHPEVGLLVVDGDAVGFGHLVGGGARVAVYPPFHDLHLAAGQGSWPEPPDPRRFVLDVHLGTLARRLRVLGFDTWYRTEADDHELADVAVSETRILLTRDRELLMRRVIVHGYLPRSDDPDDQLAEVVRRYDLADRVDPLTRCVPCNGELAPVARTEVVDLVPPRTRAEHDRFVRCRDCGQVYWPGSHLDAIGRLVERVRTSRR
jgi:uncharacterized protein